ncbi:ABC transporter substrate-binding protein [Paenibacillus sp. CC-CFT747]|nr:ABC transporter substrate-binding protein [Paenibacillus sp. CC-CFT747]
MKSWRRSRNLLLVSALSLAVALTGCESAAISTSPSPSASAKPPEATKAPEGGGQAGAQTIPTDFKQSPFLDGKNLAAVKERLPSDFKITNEIPSSQMKYEIGTYGGVMRTVTSAPNWDADVFVMNNEPLLNTPGILGEEITGNVLKGYKMSDDQKTISFEMRKGLKWSDGKPVTTEDVRFTVEDVLNNPELTPIFPVWLRSGGVAEGAPLKLEVTDEYNFKISFDRPYGGILIRLAIQGWRGYTELVKPAHYLKQFHKKYTPLEKLEPAIKEAGFQPGNGLTSSTTRTSRTGSWPTRKPSGSPSSIRG